MAWRRGFRKNATHRSTLAGLPSSGVSEPKLKIAWMNDRLRRATTAMEKALEQARLAMGTDIGVGHSLRTISNILQDAIEAEKEDAKR